MPTILDTFTCDHYEIKNGVYNVFSDLATIKNIKKFPIRFGKIEGTFECSTNKLLNIKGSPKEVTGTFYVQNNQITSLVGGPEEIEESYYCNSNLLSNLIGSPKKVPGYFSCINNYALTSFEGLPDFVGRGFMCEWTGYGNLPMLMLLRYKNTFVQNNQLLTDILRRNHINSGVSKKQSVLNCQKEMIDNGFVSNAAW